MNAHDDDTDPTGMRALLRRLPDPGPMPDDLVQRIHASLADLPPFETTTDLDDAASGDVSRGTRGAARPPWWIRHAGKAAVAAVVLIGGGAVATGQLGSLGSGGDAATSADSAAGGQRETLSRTTPDSDAPKDFGAGEDSRAGSVALGAIVVRQSGREYSAADLPTELRGAEGGPTTTPLSAEAPGVGPIGTETGVRSCLAALGLPRDSAAEVDLSSLDSTPAAVLIVTVEGARTAYAVGRDCTTGNPSVLAGPVTLP